MNLLEQYTKAKALNEKRLYTKDEADKNSRYDCARIMHENYGEALHNFNGNAPECFAALEAAMGLLEKTVEKLKENHSELLEHGVTDYELIELIDSAKSLGITTGEEK